MTQEQAGKAAPEPRGKLGLPVGVGRALAETLAELGVVLLAMVAVRTQAWQSVSLSDFGHFFCFAALAVLLLSSLKVGVIRWLLPGRPGSDE